MITLNTYLKEYRNAIRTGLLIVLVSLLGLLAVYYNLPAGDYGGYGIARLHLDINGKERAFEGEIVKDMTVFDALRTSALVGNIGFDYYVEGGRLVIKSIDGYNAEESEKPINFLLNSSSIDAEMIDQIPIKAGDLIIVRVK